VKNDGSDGDRERLDPRVVDHVKETLHGIEEEEEWQSGQLRIPLPENPESAQD
jgi:hypothetical protein